MSHHTTLTLDSGHDLTTQGFTPNSTAPDSSFVKCLQCAHVNRARLKAIPPVTTFVLNAPRHVATIRTPQLCLERWLEEI
jgi:hypothetical protein